MACFYARNEYLLLKRETLIREPIKNEESDKDQERETGRSEDKKLNIT